MTRSALGGALALLVVVGSAAAQQGGRASVRVDGRTVFRVAALDTLGARERAARIEARLEQLVDVPGGAVHVVVDRTSGGLAVVVSGVPVVTITPEDTLAQAAGAEELAAAWGVVLERAITAARGQRRTPLARFGVQVRASVTNAFARVAESAIVVIPRLLASLLVLLLFWAVAAGARWALRRLFRVVIRDITLESLILRSTYYAIWMIGVIVAVGALGLDPTTVATGLGLTGIALGFALKDILSNFVSGLLILLMRPFRLGDQIVVGETEGTVQRIELRATQIRTYDGRSALVPNAEVFTSRLINNTATPMRRGNVTLYLGYDTDLARAEEVAARAAAGTPGVLSEPSPSVRVRDLTADDVVMDVRFWTDSRRSDYLDTASAVRRAALTALADAGVPMPDPDVRYVVRRAEPG